MPKEGESREQSGEYPYTRGIHSEMYRKKLWTMRQYSGFGDAQKTNERFKFLLSQGTTGLSCAFDLPTQMGRDADHDLSRGEVGRVGVSISSVEDMHLLLKDIPLDEISLSMTINSTASILLPFLLVVAEERGISWKALRGTTQNDILKEYIARGTYIYPPASGLRLVGDLFTFCEQHVPLWNTISISGYHIREAGSTAEQELAFTILNGIAYLELAKERGVNLVNVCRRFSFFLNCHNGFVTEIAKFRAARKIWAKVVCERFQISDERAQKFRFHTQTAGSSLTAQQPYNNIVRTTLQALAAVLGGTQSLHTNGFDEALGLPTRESAELALRTQQIIAFETGLRNEVDPLGGSYAVEERTLAIEKAVEQIISEVDARGGTLQALEEGYFRDAIDSASYDYQLEVERGEQKIVGVNCFQSEGESEVAILKVSAEDEKLQRERLKALRTKRDNQSVQKALSELKAKAQTKESVLPALIEASRVRATLGEISDVFRSEFGEFRPG